MTPILKTTDIGSAEVLASSVFKQAMRNVPGSVSIVTSGRKPERHGLTVTAGCSLSTDPSSVLVCVNRSAGAHDTIARSEVFCWNILAAVQVSLAQRFAGLDGSKGDIRFSSDEDEWGELVTGAPVLANALCSFDCRVTGIYPAASHTIFVGAAVAEAHQVDQEALIYVQGRFAVPRHHDGPDV
jgi:flavin reductase (DIM6/NTAB) family NADH-FMN oxidoreductase RutF